MTTRPTASSSSSTAPRRSSLSPAGTSPRAASTAAATTTTTTRRSSLATTATRRSSTTTTAATPQAKASAAASHSIRPRAAATATAAPHAQKKPPAAAAAAAKEEEEGERTANEAELAELREKVSAMADALELAQVEKELLQEELDALREETAAAASASSVVAETAGSDASEGAKALAAENATLRATLVKVREIAVREAGDARAREDELAQRVDALQDVLDESEAELEDREREAALLKEQLDELHAMAGHVERLTMSNAALTDDNRRLRALVHELEEWKSVSEAMEAEQNDEMRRLRSSNRELEDEAIEARRVIENARDAIQQREVAIAQLTDVVQALKAAAASATEASESGQTKEDSLRATVRDQQTALADLSLRLHTSEAKAASLRVDFETARFAATQADESLAVIKSMLTDGFADTELSALGAKLAAERIAKKSALLRDVLLGRPSERRPPAETQFFLNAAFRIAAIGHSAELLAASIAKAPAETLSRAASVLQDLKALEKPLDGWLSLAKRDQLTMALPLAQLDELGSKVQGVASRFDEQPEAADSDLAFRALLFSIRCRTLATARLQLVTLFDDLKSGGTSFPLQEDSFAPVAAIPAGNLLSLADLLAGLSGSLANGADWKQNFEAKDCVARFETCSETVNGVASELDAAYTAIKSAASDGDETVFNEGAAKLSAALTPALGPLMSAIAAANEAATSASRLCRSQPLSLPGQPAPWSAGAKAAREKLSRAEATEKELEDARKMMAAAAESLSNAERQLAEERRISESVKERLEMVQKREEAARSAWEKERADAQRAAADATEELRKENDEMAKELRDARRQLRQQTAAQAQPPSATAIALGRLVASAVVPPITPPPPPHSARAALATPSSAVSPTLPTADLSAMKAASAEVRRLRETQRRTAEENKRLSERLLRLNIDWMQLRVHEVAEASARRRQKNRPQVLGAMSDAEHRAALHMASLAVIDLHNKALWVAQRNLVVVDQLQA